jgi:hypothetical protein
MSGNLELVRSIYADWERGDFSSPGWARPGIEYVVVDGAAPGKWRGLDRMARGEREFLSSFQGYRVEAEGFRELDGQRVLVLTRSHGRGKTSRLNFEQLRAKAANLFYVHAGKVTKLILYFDRDEALADLGLKE